ncbi:cation-translocating P-type ATPase [Natrinema thermotolerans]|uniref:Cation-translocating P-type ATPase n=1 Tax=Natrinema thermotolerans TaxID=121872 RepID=A0AAF0PGF2_9EURY|nr:cation-translocating P-type ATPase [Natrinema thermotolerans]QCC57684.1 cation-transporting P-type ATPase [Natrinema thermotolerans]WMT08765.1 cation-translocating P-type ATPase [Natrinema thermotolerans]
MSTESDATEGTDGGGQRRELTARLAVPEMDCPSCAGKVDKSLERVEGVVDVDLNPTTGTATVTYDRDRTSEADVVAAIEGAGYEVTGGTADDGATESDSSGDGVDVAPPSEVWTSPRAKKTWLGAVFVTLGLGFEFLLTGGNVAVASVLEYPLHVADLLFLGAVAVSGVPVVRSGYYSAKNRSLDIDLLMGTAIIAATGIGYFVEAATLAVLFSIAELLEDYAMDRARDSLRELMELSPDEATVMRDGEEVTVDADDVAVGETVVVRPGDKIPLDGTVREGESAVDESPITGESVPVDKSTGDEVYAGTITEDGYLEVEVTSTAGDSTLSRIIEMVQGAQAKRTETEQFVDRFAGYYTPVVVVLAILTAAVPPLLIGDPITAGVAGYEIVFSGDWGTWFVRGLTLLVIACPCAFVISTPVSVVSGVTSAARNGVLIKGGTYLEAMGEVDAVAVDKTGTLTKGELAVTDVVPCAAPSAANEASGETASQAGGTDEATLLRYAAGLERRSEHPIAAAILARADEADVGDLPEPTGFESLTGRGIRGEIEGETYYAGKPALFEELGFDLSRTRADDPSSDPRTDGGAAPESALAADEGTFAEETLAALEREGKTVVLVGTETDLLGAVAIADEVRPASKRAVERLHDLGVERVVMLTGDNEGTARAIAEQVGVDEYRAELLPDEKVDAVAALQEQYGDVAMVGDGINDAPALATAEVGIAMGAAGTDTALETADIALMGDDIGKLPYLYDLSHTANGVIRQNVWASLGVKALLALGVPLGLVSVAVAVVVGDMGMSLGVTGNAMRLANVEPDALTTSEGGPDAP